MSWWNPRTWKRSAARSRPVESDFSAKILGGQHYRDSPRRDAAALLEAYHTIPLLRALVDKIAEARVAVPWTLAAATSAGPERKSIAHRALQYGDQRERHRTRALLTKQQRMRAIETHPALDCLDRGNAQMVGHNVLTITYIHEELTGEACWLMERNRAGMPVMLWPIPPSAVKRTPTPGFPFFEMDFRDWRDNVPASEVIWFSRPNPVDPYGRGSSVMGALGDEWETGEYGSKHLKSFFLNRGRPELLIYGKDLRKEETERLEEKWQNNYGAGGFFRKAYQAFFMRGELEVKELSQSFKDIGMVELLKHLRDTEITALGIPPEIMGVLANSNKATIAGAERFFARWLIVPRQERTRAILQERFLPIFDERLALDYVSPVEADRDYELEVMTARPEAFAADEFRGQAGHEPLPNGQGKGHLVTHASVLVTSLEELRYEPEEPAAPAEPEDEDDDALDDDEADPKTKGLRLVAPPVREKAIQKEDIPRLLARLDPKVLERVMVPIITEAVEHFGEAVLREAEVGISFEMADPRIVEFLRTYAGERIRGMIEETTRTQLGETLAEAAELGETTAQWAARITDVFREATGARAFTIARSENTRAAGFASREAMRQAGLQKSWLSVPDDRRRDAHAGLEGQVRSIDEPFVVPDGYEYAGATAMYPGDFDEAALVISCRCQLVSAGDERKSVAWRTLRWKAMEQQRLAFERQMEPALQRAFRVQRRAVLAGLAELERAAA